MTSLRRVSTLITLALFIPSISLTVEIVQKATGRALEVIVLELSDSSVSFCTQKGGAEYQVALDQLTTKSVERLNKLPISTIKRVINRSVGGQAWVDSHSDSLRNEEERSVAGATLKLYFDHNQDGFPERLVGTTKTDQQGRYHFNITIAGNYQVALDLQSTPPELYQICRLSDEAGPNTNQFYPDTLRTRVMSIEKADMTTIDIGLLESEAKARFLGIHKASTGSLTVELQRWVYQDIALSIQHFGGDVDEESHKNANQWLN